MATAKHVLRLIQAGQRAAAVAAIAALVAEAPDIRDAWLPVANAALSVGETSLAESAARLYLAVDRTRTERLLQAAGVIAETGKLEKALKLLKPALKKTPNDAALNHFYGTVCQQLGDMPQASKYLQVALQGATLSGVTWLTLAAQHKFRENDPLLARLQQLDVAMAKTDAFNQLRYQFALGKALLDLQQYDPAFDAFAKGAALAPDAKFYDATGEAVRVDALIAERADAATRESATNAHQNRSIFVVGLPRSGTTLLQRILTTHKDVVAGGEFSGMGVATMDYLRRGETGSAALAEVATNYLHQARERFGAKGLIVDKSINNNHYVGLIARAFPTAPIVMLERNPLDTAWSCFRTCFSKGMPWSWSLVDIATHFRAEQRLMQHWKSSLPERIITVSYEDLVRTPEQVLPDLFARCGLEFNASAYKFYQRKSPVTTSSVAQVNQALNDRSVDSARHVAHRLGALADL